VRRFYTFQLLLFLASEGLSQQRDSVLVDENGMVIEVIEASKPTIKEPEYGTSVHYLLQHPRIPVNGFTPGMTRLMLAARMGDVKTLAALLNQGMAIDETDSAGKTALLHALEASQYEAAFLLIQYNANVFAEDNAGENVLHKAARNGMTSSARLFLKMDVSPEKGDKAGVTPLMLAAAFNHVEMAYMLLKAGVNPNVEDNRGNTALHAWVFGIIARKQPVSRMVVKKGKKKASKKELVEDDEEAGTELEWVAKWKKLFKTFRFERFSKNGDGFTPIEVARNAGREDISRIIENGWK
jgi:hypothetical protein